MKEEVDNVLAELGVPDVESRKLPVNSPVLPRDNVEFQAQFADYERRADALFETIPAGRIAFKKEKPEHRLMLWLALQGHNNKEIAAITGYTAWAVGQIRRQPWFLRAFTDLSTAMGRDAVETFLQGEIVPTLQKLVDLRDNAESEAVRKSACDAILDRIRGKPTVHVKSEHSGQVDNVVYDVAALEEKYARNQEILRSRGIQPTGPN